MTRLLALGSALSVAALLALSNPAGAAQQRPDGYRNNDRIEVSSARRHPRYRHHRYRYHRRYWGPPPYYYGPYYRPYYYRPVPWPIPFFGPFWF